VNSDSPQTIDRQADLFRFVQFARSANSVFETARFNHSRTSPYLLSYLILTLFANHFATSQRSLEVPLEE
jgi:hypothetical protein